MQSRGICKLAFLFFPLKCLAEGGLTESENPNLPTGLDLSLYLFGHFLAFILMCLLFSSVLEKRALFQHGSTIRARYLGWALSGVLNFFVCLFLSQWVLDWVVRQIDAYLGLMALFSLLLFVFSWWENKHWQSEQKIFLNLRNL